MTVAIALSALIAMPAMAKNPNNNTTQERTTTCTRADNSQRGDNDRRGQRPNPFAGMELTAEQQTALQDLNQSRQQQRRQRVQSDSTARAQRKEAGQQSRRDYLNQVKGILTPDQYVVFLENIVVEQPMQGRHARMQQGRQGRQDGQGQRQRQGQGRDRRGDHSSHASVNSSQMRHSQHLAQINK